MPLIPDIDSASKILETAHAAVADGKAIIERAREDHGFPLDDAGPLTRAPSATPAPLIEMIEHNKHAGRRIAAGLGLPKLREHYENIDPRDLLPDEQSWQAFATKHLPLPPERTAELIGKMVLRGGLLRCTKCGTKSKCECGCGVPYVGEHRWASPIDEGGVPPGSPALSTAPPPPLPPTLRNRTGPSQPK